MAYYLDLLTECPSVHAKHPCDVLRICHFFRCLLTIKFINILLEDVIGLNFSVIQNEEL